MRQVISQAQTRQPAPGDDVIIVFDSATGNETQILWI